MNKKQCLWYHLAITIVFIYVFYNLLTMKKTNSIYDFWHTYVMNKYCYILYLLLSLFILRLDAYTGVLLLVLAISTFKSAKKEFFTVELFNSENKSDSNINASASVNPSINTSSINNTPLNIPTSTPNIVLNNTKPNEMYNSNEMYKSDEMYKLKNTISNITNSNLESIPTKIVDGQIIANFPNPTSTQLQDTITIEKIQENVLGKDERFKVDEQAIQEILRQIKSQVDFDPYKTQLDKDVIYEIYNKYFDNDIFKKLKKNNNDSASYIAAGNFNYVPTIAKVDYDLLTYQNLSNNTGFGINPLTDGLANKTKINRG